MAFGPTGFIILLDPILNPPKDGALDPNINPVCRGGCTPTIFMNSQFGDHLKCSLMTPSSLSHELNFM